MKWVRDWLQSLPVKVNVRGLMCQAPEKVRGMAIKDLNAELFDCKDNPVVSTIQITTGTPNTVHPAQGQWPAPVTKQPDTKIEDLYRLSLAPQGSTSAPSSVSLHYKEGRAEEGEGTVPCATESTELFAQGWAAKVGRGHHT